MKSKCSLFVAVACLYSLNIYCQSPVDSLKQLTQSLPNDTSKVNTYLAFYYTDLFYDDNKQVLDYAYKALALSEEISFERGIVEAHTTLGSIYRLTSRNDSAIFHYKKATEKAQKYDYYDGLTDAIMGMGNTYNRISDWKMAITQFEKVIDLATKAGDSVKIASVHNNLGNTYLNRGLLEEALQHYQTSLKLGDEDIKKVAYINVAVVYTNLNNLNKAREYYTKALEKTTYDNNLHHLAFIYKNLGVVEKKSKNYSKALAYYNQALEVNEKISDDYNISEIQYNMGNILYEEGQYKEAIKMYRKSLTIQQAVDHKIGACYSLLAIGMAYKELVDYEKAVAQLKAAESMADSTALLTAKTDVTRELADIYKDKGDFEKALELQSAFKLLSDSLTNIRSAEKIAELETKYQTAQKEQEIELLSTENQVANLQLEQQQDLRNYLIILAVILVLLVAVAYSRYTIKVKANNKLKELDTLKTNFFTNISHEFRTPLTLILSPLEKLLKNTSDHETRQELNLIQRNAARLLELINQLLDLSKLEAGKLQLNIRRGNIKELLEITAASFETLAHTKKIDFKLKTENLPNEAYYDEDKLYKILNNLLANAFKFTPETGQVVLNAKASEGRLMITVKDTGQGLSFEEQQKVFERFHQNTSQADVGGTGIGLTLTKELVTLHHGAIYVDSKPGHGSSFTFDLPITAKAYNLGKKDIESSNASEIYKSNESKITEHKSHGLRKELPIALIVEDNPDLRRHIGSLLNDSYHVEYAQDGQEGVEMALEIVPDIIISDLMMPKVDGIALCQRLKSDERTSHVPIILLTAKADRTSKLDGLQTGADEYVTKPFDPEELKVRVKNLIDQRSNLQKKYAATIMISPSKIKVNSQEEIFIVKALEIVEEHISDPEFSVEKFQKAIGMSRMQLHRKLKALTNHSASEFIRDLRLQRAADLLSANGTSVADAAYACGFSSLSYFAQCFKEKYGVTPSKYEMEVS